MYLQYLILADDGSDRADLAEEKLKSILESPIKDTKLPLGADVTVSRVSIQDFDECASEEHNDCSDQVDLSTTKSPKLYKSFPKERSIVLYYNIVFFPFLKTVSLFKCQRQLRM